MPRVSPRLVREARRHSALLPPILKACPDIEQALLELKWIKEELPKTRWIDAVRRRSKLEPLQYILGTQPFGSLNLSCRKDVLIPRWETEEWTQRLIDTLCFNKSELFSKIKILDACTGSGCIPLLLFNELRKSTDLSLDIRGCDISNEAVALAKSNIHEVSSVSRKDDHLSFFHADVLNSSFHKNHPELTMTNIVTSNPPYIPREDYNLPYSLNGTSKSVRLHEPSLALVGDIKFYEALLQNVLLPLKANCFVFEVGYAKQALFVKNYLQTHSTEWNCGIMKDSSDKIRCVAGFQSHSEFGFMRQLWDEYIDN